MRIDKAKKTVGIEKIRKISDLSNHLKKTAENNLNSDSKNKSKDSFYEPLKKVVKNDNEKENKFETKVSEFSNEIVTMKSILDLEHTKPKTLDGDKYILERAIKAYKNSK